jgi:acetylornithine aminotransferase
VRVIDFGIGEPQEETPAFIRRALADAIEPVSTYPRREGLPVLREAVAAGWAPLRRARWIPRPRSCRPSAPRRRSSTSRRSSGREGGRHRAGLSRRRARALFAGREVVELPLTAGRGFLPDLDAVAVGRARALWLNYPNNPTAATAPASFHAEAAARARAHGVVLASDEAYSELWFAGPPPASALQSAT